MTSPVRQFEELLDQVGQLLDDVAGQQAMPDDSWKAKWAKLREELEEVTAEGFNTYSE